MVRQIDPPQFHFGLCLKFSCLMNYFCCDLYAILKKTRLFKILNEKWFQINFLLRLLKLAALKKKSDWGKLVQIKFKPNLEDIYLYFTYNCAFGKVKILWEGHNILKNIPSCFKNTKSGQNKVGHFFKFCGLLRISEL